MNFHDENIDARDDKKNEPGDVTNIQKEHWIDFTAPNQDDMVLAMSYVKKQEWRKVLDSDAGLFKGTIFPELEKPFQGKGGRSL